MGMDEKEIKSALLEAAKQNMLEILEEEIRLENLLAELPETEMIISIMKKQLNMDAGASLPEDFSKEDIIKLSEAIKISLGESISTAFKDVLRQPKLLRALKTLHSTHAEDIGSMDPVLSKRYAEVLLDFAERYMETPNWKKTEALIIMAEYLIKNVTGNAKPRLFARLDVNWGIYLWKCGDYSEAEKKLQKANAGITVLLKKHDKEVTDQTEINRNLELHARIMLGFGVLYGDSREDKTQAIKYYKECLDLLSKVEALYKNRKMRASILNNLGVTCHRMAEIHPAGREKYLNEALSHFEEGLESARSIHLSKMEGWILFNTGEIYALLGKLDKAERYSLNARVIFTEETPSERGLSGVEMLDAVINIEKKEFPKALESIERSIVLREKLKEPRRLADALDMRGDIQKALGNFKEAAYDYRLAHAIYASIGSAAGMNRVEPKMKAFE